MKKGLHISIGDDDRDQARERKRDRSHDSDDEDLGALMAIPIVGIIFTTLFGTPVLIVGAIMFFSYLKSRSLHRTVRAMVEKGQEVPAALFAPPPVIRARSDMRRGVVLLMVGIGIDDLLRRGQRLGRRRLEPRRHPVPDRCSVICSSGNWKAAVDDKVPPLP